MGLKTRNASASSALQLYYYSKCGTCIKAKKWLDAQGIDYQLIDIVTQPPTKEQLGLALSRSGYPLSRLFNTSGQSYRNGNYKQKLPTLTQDQALEELAADGKLIKRPFVLLENTALVGFRPEEWQKALLD